MRTTPQAFDLQSVGKALISIPNSCTYLLYLIAVRNISTRSVRSVVILIASHMRLLLRNDNLNSFIGSERIAETEI